MTDRTHDRSTDQQHPQGSGASRDSREHRAPPAEHPQDAGELLASVGGGRGLAESGVPSLVFVLVYTLGGRDLSPALWSALGVGAVLTVLRVVRRSTAQYAVSGFLGVAIAALIAWRTGQARGFFLFGLWQAGAYAAAYLISVLVRWPLVGVVLGPLLGDGTRWRTDRRKLRAFTLASLVWIAMFVVRLAVQWPLYQADAVVALGVAKVVLGWPLFLLAALGTYLVLRASGCWPQLRWRSRSQRS